MSFSVKAQPTFEWSVKIPSPTGEQVVTFVFKHKTRDSLKEFFERVSKTDGDVATKDLLEIIENWKDVEQPFSEASLGELIQNYYGVLPAIFDAYVEALTQAKAKN